jgi:hypothetical protein
MSIEAGVNRLQIQVIHYPGGEDHEYDTRSLMVVYLLTSEDPTMEERLALQAFLAAVKGIQKLRPEKKRSKPWRRKSS